MATTREIVGELLASSPYPDFRWMPGWDVIVRQWVRLKCMFGCPSYGRKGGCPPEVPSIEACRELFREYADMAVIHIVAQLEDPEARGAWSRQVNLELLELERAVFLAGYRKALLLFMDECQICEDCTRSRARCKEPALARPCPEALGVDVFETVRRVGYPIDVLQNKNQPMHRYAFLLVD